MEYTENGSSLGIIKRYDQIGEGKDQKWFEKLFSAAEYCYEKRVVHI